MSTTINVDEIMARVLKAANNAVFEAAGEGAEQVQKTLQGGPRWTSSQPGKPPNFQRGTLAGSVSFVHPDQGGVPLRAQVGTAEKHGLYMENGAYVRAKKGKYLPVPVNREAKELLAKMDGRSLRASGVKLVVEKSNSGALLLVEKTPTGREKKNGAVFILKVAIRILARPWLKPGMEGAVTQMHAKFKESMERSGVFA